MTTLPSRFALLSSLLLGAAALSACTVESDPYPPAVPVSGGYTSQVVVEQPPPPPPPQPEVVVPVPPSPAHIWGGGYWGWGGSRYDWHPGRWERRPSGRAHWDQPHWERRGRGHVWVEGRWR